MLKSNIKTRLWKNNSCFIAIFLCLVLLCALSATSGEAATIYVDSDASGSDDGSSWADASTDLNGVINGANPGDEIWVAKGTYKPTKGNAPEISFTLKDGVALYGGFSGTEISSKDRNPSVNVTILTGDIGELNVSSDNSYHVIYCNGVGDTAVIDGFTITGGNADGGGNNNRGAGMYNNKSSPKVTNCTFSENSAEYGGAMENYSFSSPAVTNCTFSGNSASGNGGAMCNDFSSSPAVTNCTFSGNSAGIRGGAMYNGSSSPAVTNCTFSGNNAVCGGAMDNHASSPEVTNCTFSGNSSDYGGVMYNDGSSSLAVTNCTFSGNNANTNGGAMYNNNSTLVIKNCILWDSFGGEIFNLGTKVPKVSHCVISGDYTGTNIISSDPMLGDLADNGGPTWTCALGGESSAIDAGLILEIASRDQRGLARPQGFTYDIGAYEYGGFSLTVVKNGAGTGEVSPNVWKHFYVLGTKVTLIATASAGSVFAGWSGDLSGDAPSTSVTMTEDKLVIAAFNMIAPDPEPSPGPAGFSFVPDNSAALDALISGTISLDLPEEFSGVSFESFSSVDVAPSSELKVILSDGFEDVMTSKDLGGTFITGISFDIPAVKSPDLNHTGVLPLDVTLNISKENLSVACIEAIEKGEKSTGITDTFLNEVEILKVIGTTTYNLIDIVRGTTCPLSDFFTITHIIREETEDFHVTFGLLVVDAAAGDSSPVQAVTISGDCRFMVFDGRTDGSFTDPLVAVERSSDIDKTSGGGGCSSAVFLPSMALLIVPLIFLCKRR